MERDGVGFEPVLLNLADSEDYRLLTTALYDLAATFVMVTTASAERTRRGDQPSEAETRLVAAAAESEARVRAMIDDIERQLDANRQARGGSR